MLLDHPFLTGECQASTLTELDIKSYKNELKEVTKLAKVTNQDQTKYLSADSPRCMKQNTNQLVFNTQDRIQMTVL